MSKDYERSQQAAASPSAPDLSVTIGKLTLPNPILTASGTFGYGVENADLLDLNAIGGLITKSLSAVPISGNPPPRIMEVAGGMLNAIGLQNIGIEEFCAVKLPALAAYRCKRIVNLVGFSEEEFVAAAERADRETAIDAIELNISCPNVKRGHALFSADPSAVASLTARVRAATSKPLIVKLSPNVTDVTVMARAAEDAGADAVSLINTLVAMAIDVTARRPVLAYATGGLSGPAIKPVALRMVHQVARQVSIPVIGIGGISNLGDVLEFLLAGASAVEIGTASFRDPGISAKLATELAARCGAADVARLCDFVGTLH